MTKTIKNKRNIFSSVVPYNIKTITTKAKVVLPDIKELIQDQTKLVWDQPVSVSESLTWLIWWFKGTISALIKLFYSIWFLLINKVPFLKIIFNPLYLLLFPIISFIFNKLSFIWKILGYIKFLRTILFGWTIIYYNFDLENLSSLIYYYYINLYSDITLTFYNLKNKFDMIYNILFNNAESANKIPAKVTEKVIEKQVIVTENKDIQFNEVNTKSIFYKKEFYISLLLVAGGAILYYYYGDINDYFRPKPPINPTSSSVLNDVDHLPIHPESIVPLPDSPASSTGTVTPRNVTINDSPYQPGNQVVDKQFQNILNNLSNANNNIASSSSNLNDDSINKSIDDIVEKINNLENKVRNTSTSNNYPTVNYPLD